MGVEFHITRAECWFDSESNPISSDEWLALVEQDPELKINAINDEFNALWFGNSTYEEPWLDWYEGRIYTKWPDTALYIKMLEIAKKLHAKVMDDECGIYDKPESWIYP
ncbi:hypothetical protein PROVRETT_05381 [Providencia rettgeri DSM 1131]|uniref:hypothetical protein n=1 Tax=Providencia TaxID=586 RepID=UPI000197CB24|nr:MULTISPECIES: hypothetical protein [Providencia]EFE55730.1 hypothetical protein PROVRETT_05381 [Providencia rettgeri DSM 1131]MCG9526647.1 hypothetical protein [Providencia rettgeri]QXA59848.1 hypothetical protein I6L79_10265 [Providencia rettgeri]BBV04305.1 hypothetical protein BML2531_20810 [Providencia rettgeri]